MPSRRQFTDCTIRKPALDDLRPMYDCIIGYGQEGWQTAQRPISLRQTMESLSNILIATNFAMAVAEADDQIVGLSLGYFGHTWWDLPDASIDMFYVRKPYRGVSNAARGLVGEMLMQFKSHGCGFVYAGAESGISEKNSRLYENLYKKFGFIDAGGGRMILNLQHGG